MPLAPPVISTKNLSFLRNGEFLFKDFSFDIAAGSYVAIIGPNGGGKTTFLQVLLGLTEPTSGSVQLFGLPISDRRARRRIGYVPQRGGLIDQTFPASVEEVVFAGRTQLLRFFLSRTKEDQDQMEKAMDLLGIAVLKKRVMSSLSGGERQRVLLARALCADPDLLILDEPVDGLDPASREEFYGALRRIHTQGKTILFVTHDVHRIASEADSAICLRHELVCHGKKACHIGEEELRNIYHKNHLELSEHHGLE